MLSVQLWTTFVILEVPNAQRFITDHHVTHPSRCGVIEWSTIPLPPTPPHQGSESDKLPWGSSTPEDCDSSLPPVRCLSIMSLRVRPLLLSQPLRASMYCTPLSSVVKMQLDLHLELHDVLRLTRSFEKGLFFHVIHLEISLLFMLPQRKAC